MDPEMLASRLKTETSATGTDESQLRQSKELKQAITRRRPRETGRGSVSRLGARRRESIVTKRRISCESGHGLRTQGRFVPRSGEISVRGD